MNVYTLGESSRGNKVSLENTSTDHPKVAYFIFFIFLSSSSRIHFLKYVCYVNMYDFTVT